jgi:hypothetical protein
MPKGSVKLIAPKPHVSAYAPFADTADIKPIIHGPTVSLSLGPTPRTPGSMLKGGKK